MTRYVSIGHRLTGWNAVKNRVQQLDLELNDDQIKAVTAQIKTLADIKPMGVEEVDVLLREYHAKIHGPNDKLMNGGVCKRKAEVALDDLETSESISVAVAAESAN